MRHVVGSVMLLTILASGNCLAGDVTVGTLKIMAPWSRATPAGAKVGGGYMSITNMGKEADRLIGGSLPQAGDFQIHEMSMDGGIMKMRELPNGLEIAPGATIVLKPGSYHVMFMDLKEPIKEGAPLKGTLKFEKAGSVDIEYKVEAIGAPSTSHDHSTH